MAKGDKKPVVMGEGIINDLTTGGTNAALSAEMGKVLAENTLPRDGSAAMTGQLHIDTTNTNKGVIIGGNSLNAYFASIGADGPNYQRTMQIKNNDSYADAATALQYSVWTDGNPQEYLILHTGNKPSGYYTGNGDATERTIATGGIGNVCIVYGGAGIAIVTPNGAACGGGDGPLTPGSLPTSEIRFNNGVLTIKTAAGVVNGSGGWYEYQVL